jgi:hypothetical protein
VLSTRIAVVAVLIACALAASAVPAFAMSPVYFTDKMDSAPVLSAAQAPNAWYVDRFAPASFESTTFDGQPRLRVGISTNDSAANRPLGFDSTFYNTQGRKFDINTPVESYIAGDLYVAADWATHNRRSDLWATTFDATPTDPPAGYPIFGFVHNNSAAPDQNGFRVFDQTNGWTMVPLPAGFAYGTWHNLRIELHADSFKYYLDNQLVYTDPVTGGSTTFGNMMVQAYNFGDEDYSAYWDNIASHPIGYVEPVTYVPVFRFYRPDRGSHFYTSDPAEKDNVIDKLSKTYRYEGIAFELNTAAPTMVAPLFRFYNVRTGVHFYTASVAERDAVIANSSALYHYEGVAYDVSLSPADAPVYRFFNKKAGTHFYTASESEKQNTIDHLGATFTYEGIGYYLAR